MNVLAQEGKGKIGKDMNIRLYYELTLGLFFFD